MAAIVENPDDAMAVSSTVIIVTSLLGGAFFTFEHTDAWMQWLTGMLPQRSLMALAEGLEQGLPWSDALGPILHIVAMALGAVGSLTTAGRFLEGRY